MRTFNTTRDANTWLKKHCAKHTLVRDPHGYYYWEDLNKQLTLENASGNSPESIYMYSIRGTDEAELRRMYENEFGPLPETCKR